MGVQGLGKGTTPPQLTPDFCSASQMMIILPAFLLHWIFLPIFPMPVSSMASSLGTSFISWSFSSTLLYVLSRSVVSDSLQPHGL